MLSDTDTLMKHLFYDRINMIQKGELEFQSELFCNYFALAQFRFIFR